MLVAEIAGNVYERQSFDRQGLLTGSARIEVGEDREVASGVEVPLTIVLYDASGVIEKRLTSVWVCQPGKEGMVMPLLFLPSETASLTSLVVEGDPILYPENPKPGRLPDIALVFKPEKGALAALGGRSEVDLNDRILTMGGEDGIEAYSVAATVEFRAYALGVRFKKERFQSFESLAPSRGLLRQVIRSSDGRSWVVRLINDVEPETRPVSRLNDLIHFGGPVFAPATFLLRVARGGMTRDWHFTDDQGQHLQLWTQPLLSFQVRLQVILAWRSCRRLFAHEREDTWDAVSFLRACGPSSA